MTHLQSGSLCLNTGRCWRSGDWAKGGRRGQKVIQKKSPLKITRGQGEHKVKEKQMNGEGAPGFKAAHRLDGRRVWCFPDWAVSPGEIRGRCLKKKRKRSSTKK